MMWRYLSHYISEAFAVNPLQIEQKNLCFITAQEAHEDEEGGASFSLAYKSTY